MKIMKLLPPLAAACGLAGWIPPASANAASLLMADLRSFFHGEPAPPPKAPPPTQLAVVSTATGVAADAQIEGFLRALADALKARDGKALQMRLSEHYAVDDLPDGMNPATCFMQAVDTVPGPSEIIVTAVTRSHDERSASVELRYGSAPVKKKIFRFDAAGKLLWTDWFRVQLQRGGA